MQRLKHGMYKTPEYRRWVYMKSRCNSDPKYTSKGITVCSRWESFENFYADMGDLPSPKHTLDRVDGTKGYSPENCRWATYQEQNRNLCTNNIYEGKTVAEIAEAVGLTHNTVAYRVANGLNPYDKPIHARTHCKKGHEWNEKNTYVTTVKRKQGGTRQQRFCRVCRAEYQRQRRKNQ